MNDDTLVRLLWPNHHPSRLLDAPALAHQTHVARVFVKAEVDRPLGNFKSLGGMIAAIRALARMTNRTIEDVLSGSGRDSLPRLVTASDGNHGLSVAAAAARCGTKATIYLPQGVSSTRVRRIEAQGAEIVEIAGTYDDAVDAAARAAAEEGALLVPDTSEDPHDAIVIDVMRGYQILTRELIAQFDQMGDRPTHVFVQAGVGGLAAAVAEGLTNHLHSPQQIVIVEPESAPSVAAALRDGRPTRLKGSLDTSAEMLSCGLASATALAILQNYTVSTVSVDETLLTRAPAVLSSAIDLETTPSGATGLAGLLRVAHEPHLREIHQLDTNARVLFIVTEGPLLAG